MDKKTLSQYRDLQREIKHLKKRLEKLKSEDYVFDRVSGSNPHFPYQQISIVIEGLKDNNQAIDRLEKILSKRLDLAQTMKFEIEKWIGNIPDSRTRLVFELRYIYGKSWVYISTKLGSGSESYARKIHDRYLEKNLKNY